MKNLKIDNNTVIYCPTEQLAKEVCNLLHELGYKWSDSSSYLNNPTYHLYDTQTCYNPLASSVGSLDFYKIEDYAILPAVDFLKLHGYTIIEEEVLVDFDMDKAKAGAKVVKGKTSKLKARIVCYDANIKYYPLLVLTDRTDGGGEFVGNYTSKGMNHSAIKRANDDLFIIEPVLKITPPQTKEMTLEEIEQQLGHKIKIVNK